MKGSKLAGVLVASAIVGLSLGDALTGHGIKGNKNLNPIVVGDGSSGSGSGSSSSGNSGSGSGSSSNSGSSGSNSGFSGSNWKSGECKTETETFNVYTVDYNIFGHFPKKYGVSVVKTCEHQSGSVNCEEGTVIHLDTGGSVGSYTEYNCTG